MSKNHGLLRKESESLALLSRLSHRKLVVSFSGGKDSLVALDLAYRVGIRRAVFCDTTVEFPETLEYIEEIEDFYGINIDTVRSRVSFFEMTEKIGIPSRRSRWCCEVFKFSPLAKYARRRGLDGFVTGLRRNESRRRNDYGHSDRLFLIPANQINPLLSWNVKDVWDYVLKYGLPSNRLYEDYDRVGCWCCPYRTNGDWEKTAHRHPELVERFKNVLETYSFRIRVRDRKKYVESGWSSWISRQRRTQVGMSEPCQNGIDGESILVLTLHSEDDVGRIEKVLPILSGDFRAVGKRIRINIPTSLRDKARILIEKALNCVGCDVCPSVCPTGALSSNGSGLHVAKESCNQCLKCLSATVDTLRGACIARNYSVQKGILAEA